jgi:integrase/recombinase XerD
MSALAPTLQAFFTQRLISQRQASSNTVAAYRDAWRLLLRHAQDRIGKQPCQLDLADLDAPFIADFLDHLEHDRGNSVRTRNARLAAIRSFFRYAALCHPEHAGLIARVLAIPAKKAERRELCYLSQPEADALLAAPGRDTWTGRRDHALLDVAVDTGLRVSELTGLRNRDVELGTGAHLNCLGKGRKRRGTPLRRQTAAVLAALDERAWRRARRPGLPQPPRRPDQPWRRGTPDRQARRRGRQALPLAARQAGHAPRATPLLRHVLAGPRRGHRGDRALARA